MIMKKILQFTQIWVTLLYVKCSLVTDELDQQGIHIKDYCPKIGICEEGTHVLCTHYNPNREMSPFCINYKNVSITEEYADFILSTINGIRSRIARGLPLGDMTIPRGYSMFRLEWDGELATFAQLWANQCILRADYCRATKKFPDPEQARSATFFTMDWIPQTVAGRFNYTGFSKEKVKYGIESTLNFWYRQKYSINDIASVLKGHIWDESVRDSQFLQIIQGSATHIGCGVSAFTYTTITLSIYKNVNAVRVVCNLSTRLRKGQSIYRMDPPTEVGYTKKCGCPLGYDEDASCLCYESHRALARSCKYGKCAPNIVVLPIFTVENKPPPIKKSRRRQHDMDSIQSNQSRSYRTNTSIFAKSPIFTLSKRRSRYNKPLSNIRSDVSPRKDFSNIGSVVASYYRNRKNSLHDLNYTGKYLNSYYDKRYQNPKNNIYIYRDDDHAFDYNTTKLIQNEAPPLSNKNVQRDPNAIHFPLENRIEKFKFPSTTDRKLIDSDVKSIDSDRKLIDSDIKLVDLLNELEDQAKTLYISRNEKDVFDKKIKKIYGSFIDKSNKDKNNVPYKHHDIRINGYDKPYLRSESGDIYKSIPLNDKYYIKNKERSTEGIAQFNNKISARKVIFLNNRREPPNISDDLNFHRTYMKNRPKVNRIQHYEDNIDDKADYKPEAISATYLKSKWIYRRPQKLTFS